MLGFLADDLGLLTDFAHVVGDISEGGCRVHDDVDWVSESTGLSCGAGRFYTLL